MRTRDHRGTEPLFSMHRVHIHFIVWLLGTRPWLLDLEASQNNGTGRNSAHYWKRKVIISPATKTVISSRDRLDMLAHVVEVTNHYLNGFKAKFMRWRTCLTLLRWTSRPETRGKWNTIFQLRNIALAFCYSYTHTSLFLWVIIKKTLLQYIIQRATTGQFTEGKRLWNTLL